MASYSVPKADTYLGLAKQHTALQGTAWAARASKEAEFNTRLLSAVKAADQLAWRAELAARCPPAPVPHALPAGTGGMRHAHGLTSTPALQQQRRRPRSAATASGGFLALLPESARYGQQHRQSLPQRPASAAKSKSRWREETAASRAHAEAGRERATEARYRELGRVHHMSVPQLGLHQRPTPPVDPRLFHGHPAQEGRAAARREVLAARHKAREATRSTAAQEAQDAREQAAAWRVHAEESWRVLARLEGAVEARRELLGDGHPHTIAAIENLEQYLAAEEPESCAPQPPTGT